MHIADRRSRKGSFLLALMLLGTLLIMMVSGCKGSDSAPFGSVVSIAPVGNVVIVSSPTGTTKTQVYRVSVADSTGLPMNGMTVNVSANFTSGVQINLNGIMGNAGTLVGFSKATGDSGFFDFALTAPLLNPSGQQMQPPTSVSALAVPSGGILPDATTFDYAVTALDSMGGETNPSLASALTTTANSSVQISWSAVPGAAGYNIYGRIGGSLGLIASVGSSVLTFTDTGSTVPGMTPPVSNTTFPVNVVQGSITATSGSEVASTDISL